MLHSVSTNYMRNKYCTAQSCDLKLVKWNKVMCVTLFLLNIRDNDLSLSRQWWAKKAFNTLIWLSINQHRSFTQLVELLMLLSDNEVFSFKSPFLVSDVPIFRVIWSLDESGHGLSFFPLGDSRTSSGQSLTAHPQALDDTRREFIKRWHRTISTATPSHTTSPAR